MSSLTNCDDFHPLFPPFDNPKKKLVNSRLPHRIPLFGTRQGQSTVRSLPAQECPTVSHCSAEFAPASGSSICTFLILMLLFPCLNETMFIVLFLQSIEVSELRRQIVWFRFLLLIFVGSSFRGRRPKVPASRSVVCDRSARTGCGNFLGQGSWEPQTHRAKYSATFCV